MKLNTILVGLSLLGLVGCTHRIGDLSTIGARDLDKNANYQELRRDVVGKDITLHTVLFLFGPVHTPHIEDAVKKAVAKVPGGAYMTNVVVKERYNPFLLFSTRIISVRGDVWGIPQTEVINIHGFRVDDEVAWKKEKGLGKDKWFNGIVVGIAQESLSVVHKNKKGVSIITEVPSALAFQKKEAPKSEEEKAEEANTAAEETETIPEGSN